MALLASGSAWGAGGHHAVDDAAILEPGQCELETWGTRSHGGARALHLGAGCRVGPVELAAALEGSREAGQGASGQSLQLKAAHPLGGGFSVGAVVAPFWRQPAHEHGATLLLLASWTRDDWSAHANLGRDRIRHGPGEARWGVSVEHAVDAQWTAVAERYAEGGSGYARLGARWAASPTLVVDASHARRLHGPGASSWTLGATWQWQR